MQALAEDALIPTHRGEAREPREIEGLEDQEGGLAVVTDECLADRAAAGERACERDRWGRIEREIPGQVDREQRERLTACLRQGDGRRRERRQSIGPGVEGIVPYRLGTSRCRYRDC